jgi:hypothetical protein
MLFEDDIPHIDEKRVVRDFEATLLLCSSFPPRGFV